MFLRVLAQRGSPSVEDLTLDELRAMQEKRLRAMVAYAYENTRFWREWFDAAKLKPGDIETLADLSRIPLCTKTDLLKKPQEDRLSEDPINCIRVSTSGSTGGPLQCFYSKMYYDYFVSIHVFRFGRMLSVSPLDKLLGIAFAMPSNEVNDAGRPARTPTSHVFGSLRPILRPIARHLRKTVYMGYGVDEILDDVIDFEPEIIWGTPTYLRLLADAIVERRLDLIRPKAVFLTGEPLDEPSREYLDRAFGARTFGAYGANEFGYMAAECEERSGLHIMSDVVIVEVLSDEGLPVKPGECGEIVITSLLNTAMPLIRYKIGDIGILSERECACGRTLPMLESVEGRSIDCLKLASGERVSPRRIMTLMHTIENLPRCQLVQEEPNAFTLRVFAQDSAETASSTNHFLALLRPAIEQSPVEVRYEKPDRLTVKFRPVISNVSSGTTNRRAERLVTVQ